MNSLPLVQTIFYIVGSVLSLCSIYAIFEARRQYKRGLRQRTAENLVELEEQFTKLEDILVLIDPAGERFDLELKPAVEKALRKAPQSERLNTDRELILRLDRFLRFMLLLTALVKFELLLRDALNYEYWYWFDAIRKNSYLQDYTQEYFPTLSAALKDETLTPAPHWT